MNSGRGWLLLTNDDGIEAVGFELLVKALHRAGYPLAVLAPSGNHSATGMRINLMKPMAFRGREDLVSLGDSTRMPLPCISLSWTGPRATP